MMIVSPTPGGSGFEELIPDDPADAGGVALAMALIWRFISYYPFLITGVLIVPAWIRTKFVVPAGKKI